MFQSRRRNCTVPLPLLRIFSSFSTMAFASLAVHAVEGAGIDHCARASSRCACMVAGVSPASAGWMIIFDGQIVLAGKFAKSRWSPAGTPITAPVLRYSASTKLPSQMGTRLPVEGMRGVCSSCEDAFFSPRDFRSQAVYPVHILRMRSTKSRISSARSLPASSFPQSGCSGARVRKGYAINGIRPGGEDFDFGNAVVIPFEVKTMDAPSDLPIQLRCMARTRSGQPPSKLFPDPAGVPRHNL